MLATVEIRHITAENRHVGDGEYVNQGPGKCNYIVEIWCESRSIRNKWQGYNDRVEKGFINGYPWWQDWI